MLGRRDAVGSCFALRGAKSDDSSCVADKPKGLATCAIYCGATWRPDTFPHCEVAGEEAAHQYNIAVYRKHFNKQL